MRVGAPDIFKFSSILAVDAGGSPDHYPYLSSSSFENSIHTRTTYTTAVTTIVVDIDAIHRFQRRASSCPAAALMAGQERSFWRGPACDQSDSPFFSAAALRALLASSRSAFLVSFSSIVTPAILPVNLNGDL